MADRAIFIEFSTTPQAHDFFPPSQTDRRVGGIHQQLGMGADHLKTKSSMHALTLHAHGVNARRVQGAFRVTIEDMHEPDHARITRVVGARVRAIRVSRGISQQDLAELSQVHATHVGRLERGVGNPKLDTLARIAVSLDAPLSDLMQDVTAEVVEPKASRRISAKDLIRAREAQEQEKRESY